MIRVFLLSRTGMFGEGIRCLLRQWTDIEFAGYTLDPETAIARISELKPAVVLIENGIPQCSPAMIMARVLSTGIKTRIIGVDADSNLITLYREGQQMVAQSRDLFGAIKGDESHDATLAAEIGSEPK